MNGPRGAMPSRFIAMQVGRACRNLVIWNGLLLLSLVAIGALSAVYYFNFFFGPFPADDKALLEAAEHPGNGGLISYVALHDRQLLPTGFKVVTTVDGKPRSSTPYFFTPVGDRVMLVMAQSEADGRSLVGPLYAVPDKVQREVVEPVVQRHPELRGRFLPVMINGVAAFTVVGWIGLGVLIPLTLLAVANLFRAALYLVLPILHPVARNRERAEDIDQEVDEGPAQQFAAVTITRSWLLRRTTFGLRAVRLRDAVWVYGQTARGIHAVVICLRSGKTVYAKVPAKDQLLAVQTVAERVPWAFVGHNKELASRWRTQREAVIREAQDRRQQMERNG
jgi:hypothetical protein